ncbi:MAG: hypothetical protein DRG66_00405 [Deltaproteobacteria bacterium]|nr:MAG: hypothetical protein DRG66_00405 [Deltaproteobacteria bacterium]
MENNMNIALYIIAILWIVIGIFVILYTERTMKIFKKLFFIEKVRVLAILPIIFGIVLIIGAFVCTQIFFLSLILGLLALLKGLYLVMGPLPQIKRLMDWWFNKANDSYIRLCGLIIFVLGIAMISNLR